MMAQLGRRRAHAPQGKRPKPNQKRRRTSRRPDGLTVQGPGHPGPEVFLRRNRPAKVQEDLEARNPRHTRPGLFHGVGHRLPSSLRTLPWIARFRVRLESVRRSLLVLTRLWRRPYGPFSRPQPNDLQRPSPGESAQHRRAVGESSPLGQSGLGHQRIGPCSASGRERRSGWTHRNSCHLFQQATFTLGVK